MMKQFSFRFRDWWINAEPPNRRAVRKDEDTAHALPGDGGKLEGAGEEVELAAHFDPVAFDIGVEAAAPHGGIDVAGAGDGIADEGAGFGDVLVAVPGTADAVHGAFKVFGGAVEVVLASGTVEAAAVEGATEGTHEFVGIVLAVVDGARDDLNGGGGVRTAGPAALGGLGGEKQGSERQEARSTCR
jgi:hypothetical protein